MPNWLFHCDRRGKQGPVQPLSVTLHISKCVFKSCMSLCAAPIARDFTAAPPLTAPLFSCALQWLSHLGVYTHTISELGMITLERLYLLLQSRQILF